jgi:hypothetical protein
MKLETNVLGNTIWQLVSNLWFQTHCSRAEVSETSRHEGLKLISHILNKMESANWDWIRRFVVCFQWHANQGPNKLREQLK